ncbi:MAG: Lrp/AsnC family transcriptional regulator [Sphingomonadales bacterium]|jgi:Lrp/AsnC family leucine-responsive transcriptional regulator
MNTDYTDLKIIKALAENARISMADLARALKLSPPTVTERVKRLEEAGIITGYSAKVDYEALGYPVAAWIRIRAVPGELKRVAEIIKSRPEIVQCDRITGEDCFIARAYLRRQSELEALLDELIPYAMTNTSIIQSSPVEPRLLTLTKKADVD